MIALQKSVLEHSPTSQYIAALSSWTVLYQEPVPVVISSQRSTLGSESSSVPTDTLLLSPPGHELLKLKKSFYQIWLLFRNERYPRCARSCSSWKYHFYCLFDDFCVRTSKNTAENKPDMSSSSLSFVLVSDRSLRTSSTACSYPDSSGCLSRTCPILFV